MCNIYFIDLDTYAKSLTNKEHKQYVTKPTIFTSALAS